VNRTPWWNVVLDMLMIDGIPLHPLVVHAVVVLLPLAALGAVVIAMRTSWRRSLGIPVLLVALAGVAAVPVATRTGDQLEHALPGENPLIQAHEELGERLLPYAVGFLVLVAAAVIVEISAARAAAGNHAVQTAVVRRSRVATGLAALAALVGIAVTWQVVLIGHAGASAVWQGVGQ
jgi:hypothetical protein